jgi:aminoglycoside phosphotransferase (APT) family kinase protein
LGLRVIADGPAETPGVDPERAAHWLVGHVDGLEPPVRFSFISGGRSNLTYRIDDGSGLGPLVLRRPPVGGVLETAHDMGREWKIISGLADAPVPVAPAVAFCDDVTVIGAPFYIMGFVAGRVVDTAAVAEELTPTVRARAGFDLIDVMAALHRLEPGDVRLADLGRREGYIPRQLRRWSRQWEQSRTRDLPVVDEVHRRLAANVPVEQRTGIVHGDFRLGNMMLGVEGKIAAVLDWELATLGDVLADLGWLLSSWVEPGEETASGVVPPSAAPGFPSRAALRDRYAAASGLDLSNLDYYVAFARWRSVCINEGVYARYRAGVMGADDWDVEQFGAGIERQAQAALDALGG